MALSPVGVSYNVTVQSSPSLQAGSSARAQFVGVTEKGPLNYPTVIRSLTQYEQVFGARTSYETLYDSVRLFLEEQAGAGECYITRVVGANATNGSVTLLDASETPVETITVEVVDPGAHSADYVAVVSNAANGFNLSVVDNTTGRVIASFEGATDPADLTNLALGNRDVIVRDLGAGTNPAVGTFPLSAGNDDRDTITAETYVTALDAHKSVPAGVGVAAPGQLASAIAAGAGAHCHNVGKIFFTSPAQGATLSEAKAVGDALTGSAYGQYIGVVYPHLRVPDSSSRTRVVSPEGYVLAARAVAHRTKSYAAAPAGAARKTTWVTSPVRVLDEADINQLNTSQVNGILSEGGRHYLYNYVSLATDPNLYNLNDTDALNNLRINLDRAFRGDEILFEPNGRPVLATRIQGHVAAEMASLAEGGYLAPRLDADGNQLDPGYTVSVEDIVTSGQSAPYDQLHVQVDVRFRPTLRHIVLSLRKLDFRYTV